MTISSNKFVECSYKLFLDIDGEKELQEEATEAQPMKYIHGMGLMLPEFENNLFGKKEGDQINFTLTPDKAYGEIREDLIFDLPKDVFFNAEGKFDETVVKEGEIVPMMDNEGNKLNGLILEVGNDKIKIDFNHPMAGDTLHFEVKILTIREATEDDINDFFGAHQGCCGCGDSSSGGCGGCCC